VEITREALDDILAHAREAAPAECCGLLIGSGSRVESAHRSPNLDPSPTRFRIDPAAHFAAIHAARASGRQVVGVYHSHPATRAVPSPRDLAESLYPDYAYLIASSDEVRLFYLQASGYREEPLTVI